MNTRMILLACAATLLPLPALAIDPPTNDRLDVVLEATDKEGVILPRHAYCIFDEKTGKAGFANGENVSPAISWSKGPKEARSYALVTVDPDVPTDFTDANKEEKIIPASMPRQDFYHWALVNIPADVTKIPEATGKGETMAKSGASGDKPKFIGTPGLNDYIGFIKDKPKENFIGYDGSCPPWNDEKIHHYHFKIFALDVESLPLKQGEFTGKEMMEAIRTHILAEGEAVGKYTLNTGKVVE